MKLSILPVCLIAISSLSISKKQNKVVQFDITNQLNARPVTTLTDDKLCTWQKGIDGNGLGDGYLTQSAALFKGDKEPHALPDDPIIPANGSHPEIKLYYSNTDSLTSQACTISSDGGVGFDVPRDKYNLVCLAVTSSEGPSALTVQFNYVTGDETKEVVVPDYYNDIPATDATMCYLVHDLAKWGNKNNMTEKNHHNIDLLKLHPNPARKLQSINISKTKPGYLLLWAAVGVKQ